MTSRISLTIPERLEDLLKADGALYADVASTLVKLGKWIGDSKVVFFPEYTDHGVDHVNAVLETSCRLANTESQEELTPADAAVLAISAAVHDCALHLSEDSFVGLVSSAAPGESPYFKDPSWAQTWSTFLAIASRFDETKLKRLFGDTEPIHPPPMDCQKMTHKDRLVIGEFLRQNHPRIAQDVVRLGLPGANGSRNDLVQAPLWLRDFAGLVARSHGIPIRKAVDLVDRDQRRTAKGAHLPFLMALLRISDYLQIQAERAPSELLSVRTLKSPLSLSEWRLHESVYDINWLHDDPEAIFVQIEPDTVATFLKARSLLTSIQRELDESWAVLEEVYGCTPLKRLGLRLRRVRSNLEDEGTLAKALHCAPCEARFDTSRGELLKLLVRPLYGDHPEFGIRELVQNAVDACRERSRAEEFEADLAKEPGVTVRIDRDQRKDYWLTVDDSGIGMTLEIVKEFFLKAGASFRSSDLWRRQFTDATGHSRVLRSGRFGIGILAAFMLGDQVEVSTRHVHDDRGLAFSAGLEDEAIEIRYIDRYPGTTIRVRLNDRRLAARLTEDQGCNAEDWDSYCLSWPAVTRWSLGKALGQSLTVPGPNANLPSTWRRTSAKGYQDIQWTYLHKHAWGERFERSVFCNGVRVLGDKHHPVDSLGSAWLDFETRQIQITSPTISVFDPDANLPLNLQRTSISATLPFHEQLVSSVALDVIAWLLVSLPEQPTAHALKRLCANIHPGIVPQRLGGAACRVHGWLAFSKTGWLLLDGRLLAASGYEGIIFDPNWAHKLTLADVGCIDLDRYALAPLGMNGKEQSEWENWISAFVGEKGNRWRASIRLDHVTSKQMVLPTERFSAETEREPALAKRLARTKKQASGQWSILQGGDNDISAPSKSLLGKMASNGLPGFQKWILGAARRPNSPLGRAWMKAIGPRSIPFAIDEREALVAAAPAVFREHVRLHREMNMKRKGSIVDGDMSESDERST